MPPTLLLVIAVASIYSAVSSERISDNSFNEKGNSQGHHPWGFTLWMAGGGPLARGNGGDGCPALQAKLDRPHGITVDSPALYIGHDMGWQCLHAIGDGAIDLAVNIFERILRESPRSDHRHYLNHFTVLPPVETLKKMADNKS